MQYPIWLLTAAAVFFSLSVFAGGSMPGGSFIDDDGNLHKGSIEAVDVSGLNDDPDSGRVGS